MSCIEASGSPRAVEEGLTLVRDGGRYVIAGHYTNAGAEHRSMRTTTSTASTSRFAGAGAARPRHFSAR